MVSKRVLLVQHMEHDPPGLVGEWVEATGLRAEVVMADPAAPYPDPRAFRMVVVLGSDAAAYDDTVPWLAAELALVRRAVAHGVPVLGICFGGQLLARALGGEVRRAPRPELGWTEVQTRRPAWIAPGPWMEWHFDAFTPPPGAVELAASPAASQAFQYGPHLGVQFHPEATPEMVADWVRRGRDDLARAGVDPAAAEQPAGGWARARDAAWQLFTAWYEEAVRSEQLRTRGRGRAARRA